MNRRKFLKAAFGASLATLAPAAAIAQVVSKKKDVLKLNSGLVLDFKTKTITVQKGHTIDVYELIRIANAEGLTKKDFQGWTVFQWDVVNEGTIQTPKGDIIGRVVVYAPGTLKVFSPGFGMGASSYRKYQENVDLII